MADWRADRGVVIREPCGDRARAEGLARTTHYRPFKFPEESLEMLNDADCSIDHLFTAAGLDHVRRDHLAFRGIHRMLEPVGFSVGCVDQALPKWAAPHMNLIVCRKGAAIAADPAGAIRFEREWPR